MKLCFSSCLTFISSICDSNFLSHRYWLCATVQVLCTYGINYISGQWSDLNCDVVIIRCWFCFGFLDHEGLQYTLNHKNPFLSSLKGLRYSQRDSSWWHLKHWWSEIMMKMESLLSKSSTSEENLANWLLRTSWNSYIRNGMNSRYLHVIYHPYCVIILWTLF